MIRAGRGGGGQKSPDPAEPDTGSSGHLLPSADAATKTATETPDETAGPTATAGQAAVSAAAEGGWDGSVRRAIQHAWVRHLALLLIYTAAGIVATWPRAAWMAEGKLPATSDVSGFAWNLWWAAHQLLHPGNPFFTRYMAAPVGTHLAFSALMPLAGWVTAPVTVLFGPSASLGLLTILTPGLLCYVMYRAARLWLNEPGAIMAGGFFGLSSMLMWQDWYHVNIAIGTIFLPVTIEAAVRFRRQPRTAPAVALGLALGASILVSQESTVVAVIIAAVLLIPWLIRAVIKDRAMARRAIRPLAIGAGLGLVVASPELIGMLQQVQAGGANPPIGQLSLNYSQFGVPLPTLFAPSPRLATFRLGHLASAYSYYSNSERLEGLPTFGIVLSVLGLLGIAAGWRKRSTWAFAGLWAISAAVALGTSLVFGKGCVVSQGKYHRPGKIYGRFCHQYLPLMTNMPRTRTFPPNAPPNGVWQHVVVSNLMPYTWLVRIPGLSGLREADRFALVGLIGAAMLAGLAVQWLSKRTVTMPLIAVVVALGALEAGWSGAPPSSPGYHGVMPTALPKLDMFLARDHSGSIVVDIPYGLRGGIAFTGSAISPQALLLATHDQHPRAISYTAWVSKAAIKGVARHAFFRYLYIAERSQNPTPHQIMLARADLRTMHVGWVVMWRNMWRLYHPLARWGYVDRYLVAVGFRHTEGICLSNNRLGVPCASRNSVWLYQYQPGSHPKSG